MCIIYIYIYIYIYTYTYIHTYVYIGGGMYWMCWCSASVGCHSSSRFALETGLITLTGPNIGFEAEYIS